MEKSGLNRTKKKHPLESADFVSKAFFCWLLPYFVKGFKKGITEDDLFGPLKEHESSRLGNKLEKAWREQVRSTENPSFLMALLKVFRLELIKYAIILLIQEFVVKLSQPLLISRFLKFYEPNQSDITETEAYIYAGLIVLFALANVLSTHGYYFHVLHLGMKIRVAASSVIYRKALKLNQSALEETTIGQMVNLLSNDVGRFDFSAYYIHNLWLAPIETAVIMYLLYTHVGPTGLTGVCFLVLFIFPQMYMAKKISQYRSNTAKCTDERVRLMSEIITGIQVIKMYTWEKHFSKLVELSRRREIKQIRATSMIRAIIITCISVLHRTAVYLSILTYVLTGSTMNAAYAYTMMSFYAILRQVVTMYVPRGVTQISETLISIKRIEQFLLRNEVKLDTKTRINTKEKYITSNQTVVNGNLPIIFENRVTGIHLKNVSVKWNRNLADNNLENITFDASFNQLVAVVGKVGGGKSTFLYTILTELEPLEGSVDIKGSISYASQVPWLFRGSIKQNIIFGETFEITKYENVVRACALEKDFSSFPHGDQTLIEDRGVTLSGGQRARINLARAIYKDADIYLLDDPLSAVDSHVGKHLFDQCITQYLKNKCVVLVTHQLQYLKTVKNIYLMEQGRILAKGSFKELQETDNESIRHLMEHGKEEDENSDPNVNDLKELKTKEIENKGKPIQEKEQRGSGKISMDVYKRYLLAGGNWLVTTMMLLLFLIAQLFASLADYFITIWVNLEQWRSQNGITRNSSLDFQLNVTFINDTNFITTNNKESYMWNKILTQENSLIIYSTLIVLSIVLALTRSITFFRYCMTASTRLHNLLFDKVVRASLRFFNINPSGRILNRFSKDIGTIDEVLPLTIADTIQIGFILLSISIVIGCLNPWIIIPTVIIVLIFYGLRLVFLATSRDLKRVEAVTRSPIYTHLTASMQGLTTIRAFGAQEILKSEFDNYQNQYSAASFLFLGANRTFGFWLDFHCVIYTAFVIISILFIKSEILGGNVGFALTEAVGLTGMFQWGIRQWSEMENQMTSVERIQEYIEIIPESDEKTKQPPKSWPKHGNIKFNRVYLRYSQDDPYVLNNLSFEIKSKEKIGVVGRTGAGKSSLISALFRLTGIDGEILIDNVNIDGVPLEVLRSNISIIPQEPVLFSGSLRRNLDPFDEFNDEALWSALEYVELKKVISELPGGLDDKILEGGSNFSVGQRQLICLARAIIRNNKMLILDEATANVDPHTDGLIQTTIRKRFADCTVLTIAHRLNSIMDSDRVLVIDSGKVVEYDSPYKLLLNPNGIFYGLVNQKRPANAENLETKTKDHCSQKPKEE